MPSTKQPTRRLAIGVIGSCLSGVLAAQPKSSDSWKESDLIQPKDLAAALGSASGRPLILHVGFPVLYRGAHIPGSIYAGAGSKSADRELLKKALAGIAHDREIVIYCGCCPWQDCPNVDPAFRAIKQMGYERVKALVIPTNLHADWVEKGYPVEKG